METELCKWCWHTNEDHNWSEVPKGGKVFLEKCQIRTCPCKEYEP